MKPTVNADEYVAYIKGYKKNSKVNYYVFAADESGRRRQQPVFGSKDPHSFKIAGEEKIEENKSQDINVYPNPVTDRLYIDAEVEEVEVYDVYGRHQVTKTSSHQGDLSIDVSNLNSGVYFIRMNTNKGEIIKRFVKE
jgi:hypothetical protein